MGEDIVDIGGNVGPGVSQRGRSGPAMIGGGSVCGRAGGGDRCPVRAG